MSELLNLVGLITGIVLYAVLLAMVVRANRGSASTPFDPLLLATAVLGLVWNLCALPAYELPKVGIEGPIPPLTAIGFGALGFLPAVVVHSVARGERWGRLSSARLWIAAAAYGASALAAFLHVWSASVGAPVPSPFGMRLLTYSFVGLVVPLAAVTGRQPGARRALWIAALAIFAVSALHLGQLHKGDASWPIELLGHHASLPLALAILYQDYPFALADLFLKRALALLALVIVAFVAIVTFAGGSDTFAQFARTAPRQVVLLVALWVATALLYPSVRSGAVWFVDAVILRRPDYGSLRAEVLHNAQQHERASTLLDEVCDLLRPALSATGVTWRELGAATRSDIVNPVSVSGNDALVVIPTSEPPRFVVEVAALTGGRRFLSDDLATLETIAVTVARRIDAIRITQERYQRELREQEISTLATEAELRALRAQMNPHFLFNALTTIGYLIQTAPPRALETLMRLTSLLRAVLRSEGEFTTLGREMDVVESYLEIERARFEQRLRVRIEVPDHLRTLRVPPLVLQPLVENAVKHGIAPQRLGGEVAVCARLDGSADCRQLAISVHDTGAGATNEAFGLGRERGVGLRNVERRLDCQYGSAASMTIHSAAGEGTTVEIRLPATRRPSPSRDAGRAVA